MNPEAAHSLNHQPQPPPPGEVVQTHYPAPYPYPHPFSNPNPNPNRNPYSAVVTSAENYGNAAYYAQQPMYAPSAATDAPSAAAGYYQDPNSYNWQIPYAGVTTNKIGLYVAAHVNPIAPKTASKNNRKKQKVPVRHAQCEVCKIECSSEEVLGIHRQGKNHKKNLEKLKATLAPASVASSELPNNPVFGSQAQQIFCCEVCKIECNSKEHLEVHVKGKKHKKNLEKMKTTSGPNTISDPQENAIIGPQENAIIGPQENVRKRKVKANELEDLEIKRKKVVENGTGVEAVKVCDICNVVCNSDLVFQSHLAGQKHLALLNKHLAKETKVMEPKEEKVVEKTKLLETKTEIVVDTPKLLETKSENVADMSKLLEAKTENVVEKPKLLETKKKILMDSGTGVDAVKSCELCDIVCNSDLVYRYHLLGKKHMAMVKKSKAETQVTTEC